MNSQYPQSTTVAGYKTNLGLSNSVTATDVPPIPAAINSLQSSNEHLFKTICELEQRLQSILVQVGSDVKEPFPQPPIPDSLASQIREANNQVSRSTDRIQRIIAQLEL